MYPYPEKVVDYSEMRRAFEECVAATGKVSNALIMRTYVVIFANQRVYPEFARNMLADMPRTNEVTSATDLHSLVRRLRFIKFFSKMLRIDVSVAGEEVVKNLVETALTLGNRDVLRELAWAKLAAECFDHEHRIELCRIASRMNIPSEISSKILEKLKRNVVAWRLIVTGPHTIKRLDNGVTLRSTQNLSGR
jgi:hypothetical protein